MPLLSLPDHPSLRHPALDRFLALPHRGERLLVVQAPPGNGAAQFAAGWTGEPGRVLVWNPPQTGDEALLEQVGGLLDDPDGGRVAVVAGHGLPVGRLAATHPTRFAGTRDLLLTVEEIRGLAALLSTPRPPAKAIETNAGPPPSPLTAEEVHAQTGGWFIATAILIRDPQSTQSARQALLSSILHWLHPLDSGGRISQAGYLPGMSEEILAAFRPPGFEALPAMAEFADLGLVVRDAQGAWSMPSLVRECLRQSIAENHPQRRPELDQAADEALAATGRVEAAIQQAVEARAWTRLQDLLLEHWAELFVRSEPALATAVNALPRAMLGGMDVSGFLPGLLSSTDPDTVLFTLPPSRPDYARDETLQRLRTVTTQLYRKPDQQALTLGTIEVAHLRRVGLFIESADAALRLETALSAALASGHVRPVMASFVELQSGISLHMADRLTEAKKAYESAYQSASRGSADFLRANAAGKLALLSCQQGNTDRARYWIAKVDEPLSRVQWARIVAGFAADVARVHLALTELDLVAARALLDRLPQDLDTDEFWASHAALLARTANLEGRGAEAARWIVGWRQERPYAVQSPLAKRILSEAFHAARLGTGDLTVVPGWDRSQGLADLEALRCLLAGNPAGAQRALRTPVRTGQRHQHMAALMGEAVRTVAMPRDGDDPVLRRLASIHHPGGELSDLAVFNAQGWTPVLRAAGLVDDVGAARLATLPLSTFTVRAVPSLTPREREVLEGLRAGMTRKEMAESSYRSENTIKGQMRSLYLKLGASGSAEALEQARFFGL